MIQEPTVAGGNTDLSDMLDGLDLCGIIMGNLWQFFGLPDPEIASTAVNKKNVKKKEENNLVQGKLIQEEVLNPPPEKVVVA